MRIAVPSSNGGGLEDTLAPVFARAPVFTIVDVENNEIKNVRTLQNQAAYAGGGAGPMAVQMLINEGVDTVVTAQIGPNAIGAIQAAGIRYYTFPAGTPIKEAIESIIKGGAPSQTAPAFPQAPFQPPQPGQYYPPAPPYPAYGYGFGFGRGRGRGGRGRGGYGWGARLGYCPWTGMPNRRSWLARFFGWW